MVTADYDSCQHDCVHTDCSHMEDVHYSLVISATILDCSQETSLRGKVHVSFDVLGKLARVTSRAMCDSTAQITSHTSPTKSICHATLLTKGSEGSPCFTIDCDSHGSTSYCSRHFSNVLPIMGRRGGERWCCTGCL